MRKQSKDDALAHTTFKRPAEGGGLKRHEEEGGAKLGKISAQMLWK